MKLQKQPNKASCVAVAFAMVLDFSFEEIFNFFGHDGTEIIWPEYEIPECYRGFHIQELIYFSYIKGFYCITFQALPTLTKLNTNLIYEVKLFNEEEFISLLKESNGVLIGTGYSGTRHAVAWNSKEFKIYDPNGEIYELENFIIETFLAVRPKE